MSAPRFSVSSKIIGDTAIIYPSGYLNNMAGQSLVEECTSHLDKGITKLVLNLRDTGFINSIGISLLLNIMDGLKTVDGKLCFTQISAVHRDTFDMLGLAPFLLVFENEEEALRQLGSPETLKSGKAINGNNA